MVALFIIALLVAIILAVRLVSVLEESKREKASSDERFSAMTVQVTELTSKNEKLQHSLDRYLQIIDNKNAQID